MRHVTEGVEALASQGRRKENTGSIRPTSNAARRDASAPENARDFCDNTLSVAVGARIVTQQLSQFGCGAGDYRLVDDAQVVLLRFEEGAAKEAQEGDPVARSGVGAGAMPNSTVHDHHRPLRTFDLDGVFVLDKGPKNLINFAPVKSTPSLVINTALSELSLEPMSISTLPRRSGRVIFAAETEAKTRFG